MLGIRNGKKQSALSNWEPTPTPTEKRRDTAEAGRHGQAPRLYTAVRRVSCGFVFFPRWPRLASASASTRVAHCSASERARQWCGMARGRPGRRTDQGRTTRLSRRTSFDSAAAPVDCSADRQTSVASTRGAQPRTSREWEDIRGRDSAKVRCAIADLPLLQCAPSRSSPTHSCIHPTLHGIAIVQYAP
jgi:hypothetical protein